MTIHDALRDLEQAFGGAWPKVMARELARTLCAGLMDLPVASLLARSNAQLPPDIAAQLPRLEARAKQGEPVAYLLGRQVFCGRSFIVHRHTLIPRPETELLVREAQKRIQPNSTVLDVGAGSGCIALTLALESQAQRIIASDVRIRTLAVAQKNAERLLSTAQRKRLSFLRTSLLSPTFRDRLAALRPPHLVVCANLPYLPLTDRQALHASVTAFEPTRALYAPQDGLALIFTLLRQIKKLCARLPLCSTDVLLEYDPPQTKALLAFVQRLFPHTKSHVLQDEHGRDRLLQIPIGRTDLDEMRRVGVQKNRRRTG